MLAGGIIIAIMIVPIITSVSREILRSVPGLQREAAYALGATRWEVTRIAVLSYAKKGLFGAVILGLGRALGETMAVTMVIGNRPEIAARSSRRATRWPASSPTNSPRPRPTSTARTVRNRPGAAGRDRAGQRAGAVAPENVRRPGRETATLKQMNA